MPNIKQINRRLSYKSAYATSAFGTERPVRLGLALCRCYVRSSLSNTAYSTTWENLCVDAIAGDAQIVYDCFAYVVSDNCQCSGDLRGTPSGDHMPMPS